MSASAENSTRNHPTGVETASNIKTEVIGTGSVVGLNEILQMENHPSQRYITRTVEGVDAKGLQMSLINQVLVSDSHQHSSILSMLERSGIVTSSSTVSSTAGAGSSHNTGHSSTESSAMVDVAGSVEGPPSPLTLGGNVLSQPTYVLLQTAPDGESGGAPQIYLAMQSGDNDDQTYIALHPVTVEGQDLSALTDSLGLTHGMINQSSGVSAEVSVEVEQHNADGSTIPSQVLLQPAHLLNASGGNGEGVISYLSTINPLTSVVSLGPGSLGHLFSQGQLYLTTDNGHDLMSGSQNDMDGSCLDDMSMGNSKLSSIHRRRLSNDPRTCIDCGRSFKYPSDLKKHMQIHTDVKKFRCDHCSRCFRRLHQLNVHKRIHTGEKPYVCRHCSASFRHDSTLTMHIRTRHEHLKPFACDGCGKAFGRMSHLRKHQKFVCGKALPRTPQMNSGCKFCGRHFIKKYDLKQHVQMCEKKPDRIMESATMTQPSLVCPDCSKEFSRTYDLRRHRASHSNEKPFTCVICSKAFKEKASYRKHMKRIHISYADITTDMSLDGAPNIGSSVSISSLDLTATSGSHVVVADSSGIISQADILAFPDMAAALGISAVMQEDNGQYHSSVVHIVDGSMEGVTVQVDPSLLQGPNGEDFQLLLNSSTQKVSMSTDSQGSVLIDNHDAFEKTGPQ